MKKKLIGILLFVTIALCTLGLVGCGSNGDENNGSPLQTITGVTYSAVTTDYDGEEKEILISGNLPEGATVVYTNNKQMREFMMV